jgi:hypothetical protein
MQGRCAGAVGLFARCLYFAASRNQKESGGSQLPSPLFLFHQLINRARAVLLAVALLISPLAATATQGVGEVAQVGEVVRKGAEECTIPPSQSYTDQFRFEPSEEHRAFADSLGTDTVIGSISVRRFNVFNMEDPKESYWLYGLANQLNFITWESVIRQQLLVAKGDPYDPSRLDESERLLRELDFIYDATVRPWRLCGNVVDLEVLTRDVWTLNLTVNASRSGGDNEFAVGFSDSNVLGSGKEITYLHESDPDRSGDTIAYGDPALFGSRWTLQATLSDYDDGYLRHLGLERPFFSVYEEWSAGIDATQGKFEQATWYRGDEVTEFNQEYQVYDTHGGIAPHAREKQRVDRWLFGAHYETNDFSYSSSDIPPPELPADRDYVYPYIGYESIEDKFQEVINMNYLGRTEDFYVGRSFQWTLGWSGEGFGASRDLLALQGSYADALLVDDDRRMWLVNGSVKGYFSLEDDDFENLWMTAESRFYQRHGHHWTFYADGRLDYTRGLTSDQQVVLGGDTGLRGYDRNYQVGDRSFVFRLEERYYADWYPFRLFRVGAAAFVDVGRAWYQDEDNGSNGGVLADAGIGLRLNSSRAQKQRVLHIDLAFPLVRGDDVDSVQLLFRMRERF